LLAGEVQLFFFPVFVDARPQVLSGALRPLALVDSRRSPVAPDLPTLPELGYPLEAAAWFALVAPAGTPEAIVQRLAREVRRVLSLEAMRRFLDDQGIEAGDLGPEALKSYIASSTPATAAWCAKRACRSSDRIALRLIMKADHPHAHGR
jgi:tripartite-type tricarboxylate transporter receptor subunit TctC